MPADAEYLLDASALLALLRNEPGADRVQPVIWRSAITAVNLVEVLTKAAHIGIGWEEAWRTTRALGIPVIAFEEHYLQEGQRFSMLAWTSGYSLGDRICLSVGRSLDLTILTADRKWLTLPGVRVMAIR